MKLSRKMWGVLAIVLAVVFAAMAQTDGRVSGVVRDLEGKPFPDVVVTFKHEATGQTFEVKTDKSGRFAQVGMRIGMWTASFKVKEQVVWQTQVRVTVGGDEFIEADFKEISKQQAGSAEARKKQEEEQKKFEDLKTHFDAGVAALQQAQTLRLDVQTAAAEQRGPMQEQVATLFQTAITELQAAQGTAGAEDTNLHIVMAKLGEAYDGAARYEEAVAAYQKATELKPTEAGYFNNLGNALGKLGRVPEAMAAYDKSATIDPANAANAYRNAGIVLYNANKLKEAIEPLKKATQIDPAHADSWYLLGASLVAAMEYKQEGDKVLTIVQPGTAEAYQKYLDLAPNGRFAQAAKDSLATLEALGAGIQTKVKADKKKK